MDKTLLVALLLGLLVVSSQIGCGTSTSTSGPTKVADCVGVRMPWLSYTPVLRVELRPNANAIAGKSYTVTLFEKGKFRDYNDLVSFTQAQINVRDIVDVYFPATQEEEDAYCKIDVEATKNADINRDLIVTIDLRDVFSAVVSERIAVDFATISKLYIEPEPNAKPAGYYYRVVVEIAPTDEARAGQPYEARLWYTGEKGWMVYDSEEVEWTQEEISSHAIQEFYVGGRIKELCEAIINGPHELELVPM